jgi:hypothetical protein
MPVGAGLAGDSAYPRKIGYLCSGQSSCREQSISAQGRLECEQQGCCENGIRREAVNSDGSKSHCSCV